MFCYCVFRPNGNYLKLKEISNISSFRFAFRKAQGTRTQDTFIHLMVGADCGFPSGKYLIFFSILAVCCPLTLSFPVFRF